MILAGSAIASVLFLWWFATGAIFYLDGLPRRTFPMSIALATLILLASLYGLATTADATGVSDAYIASASAIGVWAWNEVLFLTGTVTGPNREAARPGIAGWERFRLAAGSVLHHEMVILASAVIVAALTVGGTNPVGLATFMVLWIMRLSTKFNIFLGVPNPGERFLPEHLRYLGGHFRKASVGLFFALSTTLATLVFTAMVTIAAATDPGEFEVVGTTLVATLLGLAIVEHWFLALPLPTADLWRWSLSSRAGPDPKETGLRPVEPEPAAHKTDKTIIDRVLHPAIAKA